MPLHLTGALVSSGLYDLPWEQPLERWPGSILVGLPRGISRHVVRFVQADGVVYAVKELGQHAAAREYRLLRDLVRAGVPCVLPTALVEGRSSPGAEPLETALVTQHLEFSLPYRALFSQTLRPATAGRLLDALAVLLVRLHLAGFYWGDCSLSNTLFRRDAGSFAAYLVDAETAEQHPVLSEGQRGYDLDMARTNIIGELMDLQEGELLETGVDPVGTGDTIVRRYRALWQALTEQELVPSGERYRVDARIRELNDLGFDVAELDIMTGFAGDLVRIRPKVVDAGHHARRLLRLTGLDVEENQARRLLNDLDAFAAAVEPGSDREQLVAQRWLGEVFRPVVLAVPRELRGKLDSAEIFHEVLEHRWFLSERAGRDVGVQAAVAGYVEGVLPGKPDERALLGSPILPDPVLPDPVLADPVLPDPAIADPVLPDRVHQPSPEAADSPAGPLPPD